MPINKIKKASWEYTISSKIERSFTFIFKFSLVTPKNTFLYKINMYDAASITPKADMNATMVFLLYAASNVKNSPTKPELPGKPSEPNVNIKKRIDNFGSFEFKPP